MKRNLGAYLILLSLVFVITSNPNSFAAILGDYNQDGVVDLQEALYALQVSAGVYPTLDPSCLLNGKGAWDTGPDYNVCDVVEHGGTFYAAQQNHTPVLVTNEPPNADYWTQLYFMGPPPIFIHGTVADEGIIFTSNHQQQTRARLSFEYAGVWGEYGGGFEPGLEPGGSLGTENAGVAGFYGNTGPSGTIGTEWAGVEGRFNSDTGPWGKLGTSFAGVEASHNDGPNVNLAFADGAMWGSYGPDGPFGGIGGEGDGVQGSYSETGPHGRLGTEDAAVVAHYNYEGGPNAALGTSDNAFYGTYTDSGPAVGPAVGIGNETVALYAVFSKTEEGIWTGPAVELGSSTHAINAYGEAYIDGNLDVTGNVTKGGGSFKIDHPLDPENKYLYHSFVESPDMMNVYNGNVILDEYGEAWVEMPEWFEALNRDFRYQLTCIGGFAPVYIAEKISENYFKIAGGTPELEVSWQVTGIRQDVYAEDNRIQVEEYKLEEERGTYLYPAGFVTQ